MHSLAAGLERERERYREIQRDTERESEREINEINYCMNVKVREGKTGSI